MTNTSVETFFVPKIVLSVPSGAIKTCKWIHSRRIGTRKEPLLAFRSGL